MKCEKQKTKDTYINGDKIEDLKSNKEGNIHGIAKQQPKRPSLPDDLLEEVLETRNLKFALNKVIQNKR